MQYSKASQDYICKENVENKISENGKKSSDYTFHMWSRVHVSINIYVYIACLIKLIKYYIGERPFPCEQCGRSFTESGALTRHLKSRWYFVMSLSMSWRHICFVIVICQKLCQGCTLTTLSLPCFSMLLNYEPKVFMTLSQGQCQWRWNGDCTKSLLLML